MGHDKKKIPHTGKTVGTDKMGHDKKKIPDTGKTVGTDKMGHDKRKYRTLVKWKEQIKWDMTKENTGHW